MGTRDRLASVLDRAQIAFEAERAGKCEGITRGSIYSRNGGNRFELCNHAPKWIVTQRGFEPQRVCGYHVKRARSMNASAERIAVLLDRAPAYQYQIEAIERIA